MAPKLFIQISNAEEALVFQGSFDKFPLSIGRSPHHTVVLPQAQVSRDQLRIEWNEGSSSFEVQALSPRNPCSANGTVFEKRSFTATREFTVDAAGLHLRFVPTKAEVEETRVVDLRDLEAASAKEPVARLHQSKKLIAMALSVVILGAVGAGLWRWGAHGTASDQSTLMTKVRGGIFEVVYPKTEDAFVAYEKELPTNALSFSERSEKFVSIGTAFAIGPNKFVSAAHVFDFDERRSPREYALRDSSGKTYPIGKIVGFSSQKDLVVFERTVPIAPLEAIELQSNAKVGDTVYTAGNAQGEGVALRSGVYSSVTVEPLQGSWNYIRFSAAASPGNSGGPLLNARGQAIGVVVMKNGEENLNYAVPIDLLATLSPKEAQFTYVGGAEVESGLRLSGETEVLSYELPTSPQQLADRASEGLYKKYLALRKKFEEKFHAQLFPEDPTLRGFLTELSPSVDESFVELDKDKAGKWNVSSVKGRRIELNARGSLWFGQRESKTKSRIEFVYYFPPSESILDYWQQPKKVMDLILKETAWNRKYGNESILIRSYGDPHETEAWEDRLGRKWLTWVWRTGFDGRSHVLSCLPFPKSIACYWNYQAQGDEPTDRFYSKINASRLLRSYYAGTQAQWRSFLQLGDAGVPRAVLESAPIFKDVRGKPGQASVSFLKGRFAFGVRDQNQEFGLGLLWSPLTPQKLEVSEVVTGGKLKGVDSRQNYSLFREPPAEVSPAYQQSWAKLMRREVPFNGTAYPQNDIVISLLGTPTQVPGENGKAFWVSTCRIGASAPPKLVKTFMSTCQAVLR